MTPYNNWTQNGSDGLSVQTRARGDLRKFHRHVYMCSIESSFLFKC